MKNKIEATTEQAFAFLRSTRTRTVGHKSHDPCNHVFLREARVMTFVAYCTDESKDLFFV